MDLGEHLHLIADAQYNIFVESMSSHGVPPTLAVFILDSMKTRLLENVYGNMLAEKSKTELEPAKKQCHEGTVDDLKEFMADAAASKENN